VAPELLTGDAPLPVVPATVSSGVAVRTASRGLVAIMDEPEHRLLASVRELRELFRAGRTEGELLRRVPGPVLHALGDAGILRMAVPLELGGEQAPLVVQFAVLEKLGEVDPAAAWYAFNVRPPALGLARLEPDVGKRVLAGPRTYLAFSNVVGTNTARRTEGGYVLNGRWPVVSGSPDASWFFLTAATSDELGADEGPEVSAAAVRNLFVPAEAVTVEDTWHARAMRATASNAVSVADWFVRDELVTSLLREPARYDDALYRVPPATALQPGVAAVMLGMAQGALDALLTLSNSRFSAARRVMLREVPRVGEIVGEAEANLRSARLLFYEAAESVAAAAGGGEVPQSVRASMWAAHFHALTVAVAVADAVYEAGGVDSLLEACPIGGFWRDVHGLAQGRQMWGQAEVDVGRVSMGIDALDPRF
jgi:alkylation response protein AidB-like acyl-CoA dehydrogenase